MVKMARLNNSSVGKAKAKAKPKATAKAKTMAAPKNPNNPGANDKPKKGETIYKWGTQPGVKDGMFPGADRMPHAGEGDPWTPGSAVPYSPTPDTGWDGGGRVTDADYWVADPYSTSKAPVHVTRVALNVDQNPVNIARYWAQKDADGRTRMENAVPIDDAAGIWSKANADKSKGKSKAKPNGPAGKIAGF